MQILHAGRYGYTPFSVSASAKKSPITPFKPSALSDRGVDRTATPSRAAPPWRSEAGYDGVEIMGSEGYLINQFLAPRTNVRTDALGRHEPRTGCASPSRSYAAPASLSATTSW